MTQETEITIQYVNAPDEAKKEWSGGSIKSTDGLLIYLPARYPSKNFVEGQRVRVGYSSKEGRTGMIHSLTGVNGVTIQGAAAPQSNGNLPVPTSPAVEPTTRVSEQISQQKGMFIMGVVGRAMGSGQFPANEISSLARHAANAWDSLSRNPDEWSH